jgi:carbamoyl-phosphate synthase large subunit
MEHIEEAGIHSGDSACSLPVHTLSPEMVDRLETQTVALARALNVGGLMNVQYAIKDDVIYVLEVNPRASRTVPFVAKTVGSPIAKVAARVMAGENLADAFGAYGAVPEPPQAQPHRGQGSGLPLCQVPRRRHAARAGNALHRRGHGA